MATKKTTKPVSLGRSGLHARGTKQGTITLPETVFGRAWNADLVHQVVVAMQANARQSNAHTKDRSEVRGGGKEAVEAKGTGRARHGSSRSPIWRHGGVTHGPRNDKDYSQKINKKMRVAALMTALSKKWNDGEILFVHKLALPETKTKHAKSALTALGAIEGFNGVATRRKNAVLLATPTSDRAIKQSFGNMGNVRIETASSMNPLDILTYKYLVLVDPSEAVKIIEGKLN